MESRKIYQTFFRSSSVAALPLAARLTFIGLWFLVQDATGLILDNPEMIRWGIWTQDTDVTTEVVEEHLALLHRGDFIESVKQNGTSYLRITNWTKYQGPPGRPRGAKNRIYPEQFEKEIWGPYPRKESKVQAYECYQTRMKEGVSPVELSTAIQNYARKVKGKDPKFMLLPSTFLGYHERWKDFLGSPDAPAAYDPAMQIIDYTNKGWWVDEEGKVRQDPPPSQ